MIFTREMLEERERTILAPYALKSGDSKGRVSDEEEEDERLCFQRDKDRIVHCKAFRRLDAKTQVFMAGSGDHYRTRLTHTIEVAQISRDIARRLGLNEDLCEAIALAHDLGHPPFGHGGEDALDNMMRQNGGTFEHNEQSRRIVEFLENPYPDFDGLNLTFETLEGMVKHQSAFDQYGKEFEIVAHLEGQVVNLADEIAYTNHDIDDGLRSGLITLAELERLELWQLAADEVAQKYGELEGEIFISRNISTIISLMIEDLCQIVVRNLEQGEVGAIVHLSEGMKSLIASLRRFLYDNFYMNTKVVSFVERGKKMITGLFEYYMKNPSALPKRFLRDGDDFAVNVKDYIAGMTDGFLVEEFEKYSEKM